MLYIVMFVRSYQIITVKTVVSKTGNLPAHVLGNMWGQSWSNIYDLVYKPENIKADSEINLTKILAEKDIDEIEMVEIAENFFVSSRI